MKKKISIQTWKTKNGAISECEANTEISDTYKKYGMSILGTREIEVECEDEVKKPRNLFVKNSDLEEIECGLMQCLSHDRYIDAKSGQNYTHFKEVLEDPDTVTEEWFASINCYNTIASVCRNKVLPYTVPINITYKRSDLK
jgi:hypothetical protein